MKYMSHNDIRKMWFSYFTSHGHKIYESASLIPINDDSLLWINAGVTPLKKYFDGSEVPASRRITNIQKCIRTNDIENVGVTRRHQTFFEMMGNFSIGDYFKDEAISFAYELLTSNEWFDIDKNLLYVTYYTEDIQTYNKWVELGLPADHLIPLEGNFWEIGEGPCGPDSEIFFDRGEKYDPDGDALDKFKKDIDQERYIEIWNNVFSQFNAKDGVDRQNYQELPSKNIDTGAGLERWCLIFQGVDSNFETDLFVPIIKKIEELTGTLYVGQTEFKVIADHIRAITFALADGASFDNVGRGYVLRRLLRRSVRLGKRLGFDGAFMYKIVPSVVEVMKEAYPYLVEKSSYVKTMIMDEENLFLKTLESGERKLKELVSESNDGTISGEDAFKLYDTYGFPFELTLEYLNEIGYTVSKDEFDKYMENQKLMSKKNAKNKSAMASQKKVLLDFKEKSEFVYGIYRLKSNILAIFSKDSLEKELKHDGYIAIDRTCFYAEAGGQVSDTGMIIGKNFKARVLDVFKGPNGQNIHKVKLLDGVISVGDSCELVVDKDRRKKIEANHSSVHILQYSLQQTISSDIKQAGSYVDDNKLRFDFTYSGKMTEDKIVAVENFANEMISKNLIVSTEILPIDKAKQMGAMALFSEKYGDIVRVVKIGKSIELCGGTHTENTRNIKKLAIYSCESKGSNLFRIEAVTGDKIESTLFNVIKPYNDEMIKLLMKAKDIIDEGRLLGIKLDFDVSINNDKPESFKDIIFNRNELEYVQTEVRNLEKKFFDMREKKILTDLSDYTSSMVNFDGVNLISKKTNNMDNVLLKAIADKLVDQLEPAFVFFANVKDNGSVNFIARSNCFINAGLVVKDASICSNGNGGGSATFAQGGGKTLEKIDDIFEHIERILKHEE